MANFETVEVNTDLLILGGGFSACGVATEAAYWAKKNGLKVTLVDKAALDRSGAVAMGLSAINQYVGVKDGDNTLEDYVRYVRQDLMGISREFPVKIWFTTSPVTWTPRFICLKNGVSKSGWMKTASTFMKVAGSS